MNQLSNTGHRSIFESVKKVNDNGVQYWLARDFQSILQYSSWDKFLNVVERAKEACRNSGHNSVDHFSHMVKMVPIGSGAQRETEDIKLSRYACYLIIQNAELKYVGLFILAGSMSHFIGDSLEYGIMWFWPFSKKQYYIHKIEKENFNKSEPLLRYYWKFFTKIYIKNYTFYAELVLIIAALLVYF